MSKVSKMYKACGLIHENYNSVAYKHFLQFILVIWYYNIIML